MEAKISVTITLPGRVMYNKKECERQEGEKTAFDKSKVEESTMEVEERGRSTTITIVSRKCVPASQTINLSEEAYFHFTGKECPSKFKGGYPAWKKLGGNEKIAWHCHRIAEALGGELKSFTILD